MITSNAENIISLGALRLPKNSTQKAGSKEKLEKEGVWGIEAPSADGGTFRAIPLLLG